MIPWIYGCWYQLLPWQLKDDTINLWLFFKITTMKKSSITTIKMILCQILCETKVDPTAAVAAHWHPCTAARSARCHPPERRRFVDAAGVVGFKNAWFHMVNSHEKWWIMVVYGSENMGKSSINGEIHGYMMIYGHLSLFKVTLTWVIPDSRGIVGPCNEAPQAHLPKIPHILCRI